MRDTALAVALAGLLLLAGCNGTVGGEATATPDATVASTPTETTTPETETPAETATAEPTDTFSASVRYPACDRVVVFADNYETLLVTFADGSSTSRSGDWSGEETFRFNDTVADIVVQSGVGSVTVANPTLDVCTSTATPDTETPTPTATPDATATSTPTATPTPAPDERVTLEHENIVYDDSDRYLYQVHLDATNDNPYPVSVTILVDWGENVTPETQQVELTVEPGEREGTILERDDVGGTVFARIVDVDRQD